MRKQKGAQSIMPAGTGAGARAAHAGPICGFADQQRTILWWWRVAARPRRSPGSRAELKQESRKRITSAAAPAFGRANPVARFFDLKEDGGLASWTPSEELCGSISWYWDWG